MQERTLNTLGKYLLQRSRTLGLSMAEVARRAGLSRQTISAISRTDSRLPTLETLVKLAEVLRVHPLRLIHLVFEDYKLPTPVQRQFRERGDLSVFVADVTIPDGMAVTAGAAFTKVWDLQNVGTVPWTRRFLKCMDDEIVTTSLSGRQVLISPRLSPALTMIPIPETAPGETVRLAVDFVAPQLPCSCVSYWKSVFADGTLCFPDSAGLTCQVRVVSMRPATVSGSPLLPP